MCLSVSLERPLMIGGEFTILQATIHFLEGQGFTRSFVHRERVVFDKYFTIHTLP